MVQQSVEKDGAKAMTENTCLNCAILECSVRETCEDNELKGKVIKQ